MRQIYEDTKYETKVNAYVLNINKSFQFKLEDKLNIKYDRDSITLLIGDNAYKAFPGDRFVIDMHSTNTVRIGKLQWRTNIYNTNDYELINLAFFRDTRLSEPTSNLLYPGDLVSIEMMLNRKNYNILKGE